MLVTTLTEIDRSSPDLRKDEQQHIADLKENNDRLQNQVSSLQSENHVLQENFSGMKIQMRQEEQDAATRESSLQANFQTLLANFLFDR